MSKKFNLVIFTSSQPYYADAVIDLIDKYNLIHRRFYRDVISAYLTVLKFYKLYSHVRRQTKEVLKRLSF